MSGDCYITSAGAFLPGEPVGNDEMEDYLGCIAGKRSRVRERILKQNGIETRYYAINKQQETVYSNAEMAANAIRSAVQKSPLELKDLELIVAATSQGDLALPGFASMVHGELESPPCEIATIHGICASGVVGLRHASSLIRTGDIHSAVSCASEFPSRLLKASRFESQGYGHGKSLPFETDFLRWMLSDSGELLCFKTALANQDSHSALTGWPFDRTQGSLRPCMFVGQKEEVTRQGVRGWLDYPDFPSAAEAGAMNLRQSVDMLPDVVRLAVNGVFELIDEGKLNPKEIDWYVTHYSSHIFREQAYELFCRGGLSIPLDRVFTNLYTKGNVGSAAPYVMIEELLYSGQLEPGEKILCIVPESGRFLFGYFLLTVVGEAVSDAESPSISVAAEKDVIEPPDIKTSGSEIEEALVRQLSRVWTDFENRLNQVPIIRKMNEGRLTLRDYRELLFNLRQQVIDGSRWISRVASNITSENFALRSAFIGHSSDEHRDFELLERNYAAVGGDLEAMRNGSKNIGSEALSEFILSRASRENPFDLIGAMFIIEGLGRRVARRWAQRIQEQLQLSDEQVSFLLYHSESDDIHFQRLDAAVQSGVLNEAIVERIVKTSKVVARLYLLQLEEIGNF